MKKLLVRPNPYVDESLLGYLSRLSEVNGYKSANQLIKVIQGRSCQATSLIPMSIYQNLMRFTELTGKTHFKLENLFFPDSHRRDISYLRWMVKSKIVDLFKLKCCPLCLRSKPYYKKIWNFSLVAVCHTHNCLLISNCPQCNNELNIHSNSFCRCKCGFDLRKIKPVEKIPEDELRVTEHMLLLLGLGTSKSNIFPNHNPLVNFSLRDFSFLIEYFSVAVLRMYDPEFISSNRVCSFYNRHLSLSKAFSIFDNFPENYLLFLHEQILYIELNNLNYLLFDNYYPNLPKTVSHSIFSFIQKTFAEYIESHLKMYLINNNKKLSVHPRFKLLPGFQEKRKFLKIKRNKLKSKLLIGELLAQYINEEQEKVSPRKIKEWWTESSYRKTQIKDTDFAKQLNIPLETAKYLAYNMSLPEVSPYFNYHGSHHYLNGDLYIKFIFKLREHLENSSADKNEKLINFVEIQNRLHFDTRKLGLFLSLSFQGKIKPCKELFNENGITRFLFTISDFKRLELSLTKESV